LGKYPQKCPKVSEINEDKPKEMMLDNSYYCKIAVFHILAIMLCTFFVGKHVTTSFFWCSFCPFVVLPYSCKMMVIVHIEQYDMLHNNARFEQEMAIGIVIER